MPATRSSSRLAAVQTTPSTATATVIASGGVKRKSTTATASSTVEKKVKKSRTKASVTDSAIAQGSISQEAGSAQVPSGGQLEGSGDEDTPVPATLTFDFEGGQKSLIGIDPRFQDLFDKMPCRPFEQLEQVHPFRALTISILGQQISWKAARSITHKFVRLYDTSIPEEVTDESREQAMDAFPSPHKVANTDAAVLRTAGLSARKGEYVLDLAKRFADGRLSTEKLRSATDEELTKMLIEVKGIGQWTVDMFAIFSLRRPDILPHSAAHPYALSPEKVGGASSKPKEKTKTTASLNADKDTLPGTGDAVNMPTEDGDDNTMESVIGETGLLPTPFTPSIKQTLKKAPKDVVPLPVGLSVSVLKSRLDGKKVKGAFLTPQEMTDLTETWRPYRSLATSLLAPLMNAPSFQTLSRPILDTTDICPLSPPSCSQQCIKGSSPPTKAFEMSRSSSGTASIKPGAEAAQTTPTACDRQSLKEIGPSTSPSSADIFSLSTTLPPAHVLFSNYPPNRQHRRDINSRVRRSRNATAGSSATTTYQPSEDESNAMQHADAVQPQSQSTALSSDKSKFSLFNNYDLNGRNYSSHFPEGHQLMPDFVDAYQLEDELGAGGYSFVMTARDRFDGYEVAVKFIIKDKVPEHCWINDPAYGKLPMEVVILSYVNHDNIVKCLDVYEDSLYFYMVQELHGSPWDRADGVALDCKWSPANSGGSTSSSSLATPSLSPSASVTSLVNHEPRTPPHVYPPLPVAVVDESEVSDDVWNNPTSKDVCQKGPHRRPSYDLFECIEQSEQKRLTEEQARYVFGQVVDAVHYLDSQGIVHRDIKDENVVIDQNLKIKLIDFGSATISDPAHPAPEYEQFFGTAAYASSEILLKKKYRAAPAEIWTLGVLLSYLLAGVSPFPTVRDAVEGRIFLSESLGLKPSEEALDLMRKCLDPDPEARIHINDIKAHSWLCGQQALP